MSVCLAYALGPLVLPNFFRKLSFLMGYLLGVIFILRSDKVLSISTFHHACFHNFALDLNKENVCPFQMFTQTACALFATFFPMYCSNYPLSLGWDV